MSTPPSTDERPEGAHENRKRQNGPPAGGAHGRQGLCPACLHVRILESERGSVFLFCQRSRREPVYSKYPPQPVRACTGFETSSP